MEITTTQTGLSKLAKWAVWLALLALMLPLLGLIAFCLAIALLIRGEIGPGLGVMVLAPVCAITGGIAALALL